MKKTAFIPQLAELAQMLHSLAEKGVDGVDYLKTLNALSPARLKQAVAFINEKEVIDESAVSTPPATPATIPDEDAPIWLQTKEQIESFLKKYWDVKTVKIISGLENDKPVISSPDELDPTLLNVHKKGDPDYLLVEEKCRRAREATGTKLGLRDALLCWKQWEKIHKEWHPYWVYFLAEVEVNGNRCVVGLDPREHGCDLDYSNLGNKSNDDDQFARSRES